MNKIYYILNLVFFVPVFVFAQSSNLNTIEEVSYRKINEKFQYLTTEKVSEDLSHIDTSICYNYTNENWENNKMTIEYFDSYNRSYKKTTYVWNNAEWNKSTQKIVFFNNEERVIQEEFHYANNNEWYNNIKREFHFNVSGNLFKSIEYTGLLTEWKEYRKYTYVLDENENIVESIQSEWTNNQWINVKKESSDFTNNNKVMYQTYTWNNNSWKIDDHIYFWEYDDANNNTEYRSLLYSGGSWVNQVKSTYVFNENGDVVSEIRYNGSGDDWIETNYKYFWTYDNTNKTEYRCQLWNGTQFLNVTKVNYQYNTFGKIIKEEHFRGDSLSWNSTTKSVWDFNGNNLFSLSTFNFENNNWNNVSKTTYYYNSEDFITESVIYQGDVDEWNYQKKCKYFTFKPLTINEVIFNSNISVFPNPIKDKARVFNLSTLNIKELSIYNLYGTMIKTISNINSKEYIIEGRDFKTGIYYLKIQLENNQIAIKKVIFL